MLSEVWDEIAYPFSNFNGWERISNFILHFLMAVISYPCWYLSEIMLLKGATWCFI